MKRIISYTFFTIMCSAVLLAQPKITVVGGASFDFGNVFKGEKVERKLTIKNTGNQTLVIDRVQASCGCTATLLSEKEVKPGKTSTLSVGFDSKNFSGVVHKNVHIYSNDVENSSLEVKFTATVLQVLETNPAYFYFPSGKVDSAMTTKVTVKNSGDKVVDILGVSSDDPVASFTLGKKKLQPGESTEIFATYRPSRTGYVSKDVVIKTSHPKQPELAVKLITNVQRAK
jgi:hypothetical protein